MWKIEHRHRGSTAVRLPTQGIDLCVWRLTDQANFAAAIVAGPFCIRTTESRSVRSVPLPGDLHSVGPRQGVPSGKVIFLSGFVADDPLAASFNEWSGFGYHYLEMT